MKKKIKKGTLSLLLSFGLTASVVSSAVPLQAADTENTTKTPSSEAYENCAEGEAIVMYTASKRTTLSQKAIPFSVSGLSVETNWNFGSASGLSESGVEVQNADEKNLYISHVTSDRLSTGELIKELSDEPGVISAEPNYYRQKTALTSDDSSDQQWYLDGSGALQTSSEGIRYQKTETSEENTPVVAVVDTGIDYTHEDLKDHMWKNTYSELGGTYGYDFGDNDADPMDEDSSGHGTHCAGVIGAVTDNEVGIAGVCTDVRLMALKIFNAAGEASDSSIIDAFHYIYQAKQLGVNITAVNCSWGGGSSGQAMETLIQKIGSLDTLFVFAAGNDGTNQDRLSQRQKECPYDMSSDYLIIVGASDTNDNAASFSDYGAESVDIFAPGVQIFSTVNYENFVPAAYGEKKRESLTSLYCDGSEENFTLYTPVDLGLSTGQVSYEDATHTDVDYYGKTDGSYLIPFESRSMRESSVTAYLDVTGVITDLSKTYYVACDNALKTGSLFYESDSLEWSHFSRKVSSSDYVTSEGKTYLRLITIEGSLHTCTGLYLDNIAISCADPDTKAFGKYDYLEGTSMAAPSITGAVASLSARFPSDKASERKTRLLSCVRSVSSLSGKCKTGGIVDMSLFNTSIIHSSATPSPTAFAPSVTETPEIPTEEDSNEDSKKIAVKKITLNKTSAKLRLKKKLKLKATVSPSNASDKRIKWSVSKKKWAKVTQKGVVRAKKKGVGKCVKVYATSKADSHIKAVCKVKIRA